MNLDDYCDFCGMVFGLTLVDLFAVGEVVELFEVFLHGEIIYVLIYYN